MSENEQHINPVDVSEETNRSIQNRPDVNKLDEKPVKTKKKKGFLF